MAPKTLEFPEGKGGMYRGDDYRLPIRFRRDISSAVFACQLRRDKWSLPIDVVIDETHKNDPLDLDDPDARPYITLFVPAAITAAVEDDISVLRGDLQDSPTHTVFKLRIPVSGEYTKPEEDE